jgi:zinc transport system permease protein
VIEPFLFRALAAGIGLAIVAAPLGCFVVWNRMAYFGETVAQASLLGVALGLMLRLDITISVLAVALIVAALLYLAGRQRTVPIDSILGLLHFGALAAGLIATALVRGPSVDLMGYLFGDVFAVTGGDLVWIYGGGAVTLAVMAGLWSRLLRLAVHEELAAAEGVDRARVRMAFTLVLALTIAIGMKIVGILLVIAFLIVPSVAARPFAATPERMVALAAAVGVASTLLGLGLSLTTDAPGGAAIVLVMSLMAGLALVLGGVGQRAR